jgi:hypothetical protein
MRRLLPLLVPLVLLAAGCGGGKGGSPSSASGQSHSVLEVSKAFSDAGLAFTSLVTGNKYVAGQVPFLPFQLNSSDLRFNVDAELNGSDTTEHTAEVVWVFDTDAHAQKALDTVPLAKWGQGPLRIDREHLGNVIIVADGFTGASKAKLDKAIAALK